MGGPAGQTWQVDGQVGGASRWVGCQGDARTERVDNGAHEGNAQGQAQPSTMNRAVVSNERSRRSAPC
eukprot:6301101-Alexandrium_andersonii.AAC.1